ncbi:cytochrome b/b6 domain-containing protein [Variovorax sp. DT-64]|uniref:cytochrome b/b6 domain-containing protein n=1 Tax=Variovorax sp. DT-64 TaxID=3396160 RepID=UPI003F196594
MNTNAESRSLPPPEPPGFQRVLVWDAPLRMFHWLMAACFAGTCLTAGQEGWRNVHQTLGYTMAGLVVFRIAWGFAGTRYARFANFVRGPAAVAACLRAMPRGWGKRHIGHSPAGAVSMVALLLLTLAAAASGWASGSNPAHGWGKALHEGAALAMLVLASLHIAGVAFGSWRAGESLARSMISGTKLGAHGEAICSARYGVALLVAAAVVCFWGYQWTAASTVAASREELREQARERAAPITEARREPGDND